MFGRLAGTDPTSVSGQRSNAETRLIAEVLVNDGDFRLLSRPKATRSDPHDNRVNIGSKGLLCFLIYLTFRPVRLVRSV
jgi:hypothetical protein